MLLATVVSLSSLAVCVSLAPSDALADESCPNATLRVGFAASLPDCRAYEMVTPVVKDSVEPELPKPAVVGEVGEAVDAGQASASGDRLAFRSSGLQFPGSRSSGFSYLATRGEAGWLPVEDLIPPQSVLNASLCPTFVNMQWYSTDLTKGILGDGWGQEVEEPAVNHVETNYECGHDEPLLVAGEPEGRQNLFVRDNKSNSYQLVNVTPVNVVPNSAYFLAASGDLSDVVFEEGAQLTANAPVFTPEASLRDIYVWSRGVVRPVTILPGSTVAVPGLLAGTTPPETVLTNGGLAGRPGADYGSITHAVSDHGSRVLFQAEGNLYIRENADQAQSAFGSKGQCIEPEKACTVEVDASQAGGSGGGGVFLAADADGSKVFFLDNASADLTTSTVSGSGQNLYEYELETGKLTDLTPVAGAEADGINGVSEDGSYMYFVAGGVLAAGATEGQPNLYVSHDGTTTFITTLNPAGDTCDWLPTLRDFGHFPPHPAEACLTARVSSDGAFLGFNSVNELTGYDNKDAVTGEPDDEIYLYDAAAHTLSCASCIPSGTQPVRSVSMGQPALTPFTIETREYLTRNVSDNGQVFFSTSQALLPRDSDGTEDVYEYEGGQLSLVSTGTSDGPSYFYDATPSGSDVFIATDQKLARRDVDNAYDIYDTRVDGGFPESGNPTACSEEDCKGAVSATPLFSVPNSATFVGDGNLTMAPSATPKAKPKSKPVKCKKQYVKRKDKCARKVKAKEKKSAKGRK